MKEENLNIYKKWSYYDEMERYEKIIIQDAIKIGRQEGAEQFKQKVKEAIDRLWIQILDKGYEQTKEEIANNKYFEDIKKELGLDE